MSHEDKVKMEAVRPSLAAILSAQERLHALLLTCSAVVLLYGGPASAQISFKLENLQPLSSFKVRPVGNVVMSQPSTAIALGIFTCSSGNSGVVLDCMAARLEMPATVIVPAEDKLPANLTLVQSLRAHILQEPFPRWWHSVETLDHPDADGVYIDSIRDPRALAGNGTVALQILKQVPDVEAILVPLGGGTLACGIGSAIRSLKPGVKVIAFELDCAQLFSAALRAGSVVSTPCSSGFVDGVGSPLDATGKVASGSRVDRRNPQGISRCGRRHDQTPGQTEQSDRRWCRRDPGGRCGDFRSPSV